MSKLKDEERSQWDKVAISLSSRAEELGNATEAFADTVFVNALKTKQNQIIYGRRGTGKTHLLKRLQEEYDKNFEKYGIIPIFINGSSLRHQANIIVQQPPLIGLSLYVEFIKLLTYQLSEFINTKLEQSFWDRFFGGEQTKKAQVVRTISKELRDLIKTGEIRYLPAGDASEEVKTLTETVAQVAGGLELNVSDPRTLGWKLTAGASGSKKKSKSGMALKSVKGEVVVPFSQVSQKIQELLGLLDGASMVVLFDEWSDIDDRLDTQPYLADMIKRTLSTITEMHVKLACIPIRTMLATPITNENPIPIGYEEVDDISADIDLDKIIYVENDLNQFLPFFMILLQKHIAMSLGWVREMDAQRLERLISEEIFDGYEAFSELCQASAGVARDFLHLFRNATSIQMRTKSPKITLFHIRNASENLYESKKRSFKSDSIELRIIDNIYRGIIAKQKTYLFLLAETDSHHPEIQLLWAERMIHRMPATYYDSKEHVRYIYYQVDYGKCVDLLSAEATLAGKKKGHALAGAIDAFSGFNWIGPLVSNVAKITLPGIMGFIEKRKALENEPGGNWSPNPREIIVKRSMLT